MRLLFATTVAHLPEGIGGMQTSTHALARRLQDAGVEVAAFAAARRPDQLVEDAAAVPTPPPADAVARRACGREHARIRTPPPRHPARWYGRIHSHYR